MPKKLLIFSFSPVQGFILTARRPRDLFTGSYIISYLTKEVIERTDLRKKVIYPVIENNDQELANYPNKFIAIVEEDKKLKEKFKEIWNEICENVWNSLDLKLEQKEKVYRQFLNHVESYFNIFCECRGFISENEWKNILGLEKEAGNNKEEKEYSYTYDLTERILGAKKSWRPYRNVIDDTTYTDEDGKEKYPDGCTMCGERLHLAFEWKKKDEIFSEKDARHIKKNEKLCGVCLVKRFAVKYAFKKDLGDDFWHYPSTEEIAGIRFKARLKDVLKEHEDIKRLIQEIYEILEKEEAPSIVRKSVIDFEGYPNIDAEFFREEAHEALFEEDIFKDNPQLKDKVKELVRKLADKGIRHTNPYFAFIMADGDSIGDWLGIKSSIRKDKLTEEFHKEFSLTLSEYAREVRKCKEAKEDEEIPKQVIYAGGDDVLAMLHPVDAVRFGQRCAEEFREKLKTLAKEDKNPSISGGIIIAHAKMPLQKVLEEAGRLEKKAKDVKGKGAVAVGVMTRSGAIKEFVAKWEDLELYNLLVDLFKERKIGHQVVQDLRFIEEKISDFGEKEKGQEQKQELKENILFSLLRRVIKRRVQEDESKEKVIQLIEEFFKRSKGYMDEEKKKNKENSERGADKDPEFSFALSNLAGLFAVARFVGTLEGKENEALQVKNV